MKRLLPLLFVLFGLMAGCTPVKEENDRFNHMQAQAIYQEAHHNYKKGHYTQAISAYEALIAHYPFGTFAEKAQYELIDAYTGQGDIASALAAADHYIKLHPRSPRIDAVYFQKGNAQLKQNQFIIQKVAHLDPAKRDTQPLQEALSSFRYLENHYPKSQYLTQAKAKIQTLESQLAEHYYGILDYYYRKHAYIATINRAQQIVSEFPQTASAPKALKKAILAYQAIDLPDKANELTVQLNKQYPVAQHTRHD